MNRRTLSLALAVCSLTASVADAQLSVAVRDISPDRSSLEPPMPTAHPEDA